MIIENKKKRSLTLTPPLIIFSVLSILILFVLAFTGCSGHRFKTPGNPLSQYDVETLSIPMFLNRSNIPDLSGAITQEMILMLSQFPGLKVYPGDWKKTDAILIGIIDSPNAWRKTVTDSPNQQPINMLYYSEDIGKRRDFNLSRTSSINTTLTLILVKNPTHREIELILNSQGDSIYQSASILFQETVSIGGGYANTLDHGTSRYYPGTRKALTNYTKTRGAQTSMSQSIAESAAQSFKEMILYAF